ncbi:phasin family protein [Methylocapsa palsarum]|uniref:Phasin protein n=1 Tax=Methylocapsa palsarum TaxID=1612308 RepID=A0A1I3XE42_9HYPH|nr:phasin family protein [Methylocapsa palsarum]SFK17817.1 Phasin protein [Methylocapsa palsarum]
MTQQDERLSAGKTGMEEAVSGMAATTKNLQAFAGEVAQMSKESFEHATQTLEKLRGAHGVEEIVTIQTNFVKEAFEHAGQYTRRLGELMSTLPLEITKSYQEAWLKSVSTAIRSAEEVGQSAVSNVERFSDSVRKV